MTFARKRNHRNLRMLFEVARAQESLASQTSCRAKGQRLAGMPVPGIEARMSMVDGFPYKEEVGGSNPSVPTIYYFRKEILAVFGQTEYRATGHDGQSEAPVQLLTFRV